MALNKQPVSINFQMGLDTKSDPYQVKVGNFLELNNSVFTTTGRLTKRNGFKNITNLPNTYQSTLATLNDNLIATGSNLYAYSSDTNQWLNQGIVQPVQLNTLPLLRVSTSQTSPDTAVAPNGLVCLAYVDSGQAYYQISDSSTGQQIVKRTALPSSAVCPRAFVLGNYFIVTCLDTVSGATHLQYVAIPLANPNSPLTIADFATNVSGLTAGYDGISANNQLYLAYGASGSAVKVGYLTSSLGANSGGTISSSSSNLMTIANDSTNSRIFISFWDSSSTNMYSAALNYSLVQVMAKTTLASSITINEITSVAKAGVQTVFYTTTNTYGYDSNIRSDYTSSITCTLPVSGTGTGTVGTATIILRSVGLASKAFTGTNGTIYMLVAYGDTNLAVSADNSNQPTYFLIDSLGNIYMRLAYSNGGGYASTQVLPSISYQNGEYYVAYLNNDFLASLNKGSTITQGNNANPTPISGIYTQTGINLASFTLNTTQQESREIAGCLNLTGGLLWEYDGVRPVENNFHVWPENVEITSQSTGGGIGVGTYYYVFCYEWTNNQGNLERSAPSIPVSIVNTTGSAITRDSTFGSNSTTITPSGGIPSGLEVGMFIEDTTNPSYILPGTYITAIGATTYTISQPTQGSSPSNNDVISTIPGSVNTIYVPTLRLTYKTTPNPVRIVGYRWSVGQPIYYQFTSITAPILNTSGTTSLWTSGSNGDVSTTSSDYVTILDTLPDSAIAGNVILYTTGGVVEDIGAPASIASALFDNRLWLVDAEDQNLLWFSKQVIENVPVEMSDLLTYYVAPTTSAQGSTGTITALYPMDDKLIVFKKDAAYYINGTGPDNTGSNSAYSQPVFITASVGCNNPNSIVLMPNGLMFQSDKGIWLLGRDLSTNYIGAPVESYNSNTVLSATAVPGTTQVRFILNNNVTLMYDYFFNQWATHSNILAISSTLYQGTHTYLNSIGQVFQETPNTYLDGSAPVLMSLTTSWINIAGLQGYERFYFGNLLGTYFSPFTFNCTLSYDYNTSASQNITILPRNYVANWGGEASWGSGGPWGGPGNVFSARFFPEKQKCQSFQVSLQEVYDPSYGQAAGEGLTLSGLQLMVGVKRGVRTQSANRSFG